MSAVESRGQAGSVKIHTVAGGGGLREWGKEDGEPIVFVQGWSQNHLCSAKQYESELADEFSSSRTTCAATACPRPHSSRSTTRTPGCGQTMSRRSSTSWVSTDPCSS